MSWQRPGAPPPAPQCPPQLAQTYGNQQQQSSVYAGYQPQPASNTTTNTQQQYWQQPQYNQNQQYAQQLPQTDYNNANQQHYTQNVQNYNAPAAAYPTQQQTYQQPGYYQPTQQPLVKTAENWDNWDWGWDDASRNQAQANTQHVNNVNAQITQPNNTNANVIEESFAPNDTWNWTTNDQKDTNTTPNSNQIEQPMSELPVENSIQPSRSSSNHSAHAPMEDVKTLNDKEVVKERLPNLALGKRFTLENLTPQWSIESQMSQESSDGPHTEGAYRSDNQSRNSSSPGPNTDQVGFSYSHPIVEEYPPDWGCRDEPRGDGCDLTDGLQDLTISNREIPAPDVPPTRKDSIASASSATGLRLDNAPSSVSLNDIPAPSASSQPSVLLPPPTGFATSSATNPFKQTSPFSHKKLPMSVVSFPVSNFGANLETAPDNAERPDQALPPPPPPPSQPLLPPPPDNLEVAPAPRRDRDEYLQTAHLTPDYGENTDFRSAPPAGLRRLVQGGAGDDPQPPPPPGLARLVPGQPSEYSDQMDRRSGRPELPGDGQASAPRPAQAAVAPPPPAPREPLLDGADYADHGNDDREVTVEGENLQDLSAVSSTELPAEPSASEPPRQHPMRPPRSDADESDRDRAFNASPRRDKHKRDKDGRYSRGDRTYDDTRRDDRRSTRDERRVADSPETRRRRRHQRHNRYDTEDTDYYSDKERERRRYREGSHTTRPPRPDDKRRYNTIERDRAKRDERDKHRDERDKERDRYKEDKRYRDIDTHRPRGGTRARTHDDRAREERVRTDREYSESSRANSRDRDRDRDRDEDDRRRRRRDHPRPAGVTATAVPRHRDRDYYDAGYGTTAGTATGGGGLHLTPQQYAYYETLRRTDPAAYLRVYTQLMAQYTPGGYAASSGAGYEERGSGHSGRSSANAMRHDTYYGIGSSVSMGVVGGGRGGGETCDDSLRHSYSMRTDISDRDLNTDASLNLQLEESTQRSGRVTPLKFSTAHVKGSISSHHMVVVHGAYPVDGRPGTVRVLTLQGQLLHEHLIAPTPLIKGVTHKKSVIEYCATQARSGPDGRDPVGRALLWDLLALMLTQNGVVVGADIAELLMKNQREFQLTRHHSHTHTYAHARNESRRSSSVSGRDEDAGAGTGTGAWSPAPSLSQHSPLDESPPTESTAAAHALDTLREHLTYGNRQEALEWAMSNKLWGHAMHLATFSERRVRAHVAARFVASIPHTDPLHSLYSHLAAKQPPAATCCSEERWGDWRSHAAIMLANVSAKPDQDTRTLTQLGDSLSSRGLLYSAQFCYLTAGVQFSKHPLAPLQQTPATTVPRLSLLLADPKAPTLAAFATDRAIFATEIYEYAMSLNQDYDIPDLQVYKLIMACRLIDCGLSQRALSYIETAAGAVTRQPHLYAPALACRLAELGDRLRYADPAALDPALMDDDANESPGRHQHWIDQVANIAQRQQTVSSQQHTPLHVQHEYYHPPPPPPADSAHQGHYSWDQVQTQSYQPLPPQTASENPSYLDPETTDLTADYSTLYHTQLPPAPGPAPGPAHTVPGEGDGGGQPQRQQYYSTEETPSSGDYWQQQYNYGETQPPAPAPAGHTPAASAPPTARVAPRLHAHSLLRASPPPAPPPPPTSADKPKASNGALVRDTTSAGSLLKPQRHNDDNINANPVVTPQLHQKPDNAVEESKGVKPSVTNVMTSKPMTNIAKATVKATPVPLSTPNVVTPVKPSVPTSLPLDLELRTGLRRRVHPKSALIHEAFIAPPASNSNRSSTRSSSESHQSQQLSDLDIQLSHQSQVCNPKQFTVPAQPRPQRSRYGAVISHTVDSWARNSLKERNEYKPLIFGGTFPIDTPTTPPDHVAHVDSKADLKPQPATVGQHPLLQPATVGQHPLLQPATVGQHSLLQPATVGQHPLLQPASVGQHPLLQPATVGQHPLLQPATVGQHPLLQPATVGQHPLLQPASVGQHPLLQPASVGQQPLLQPASVGQQPLLQGDAHRKALKHTIERSLDRFEAILARRVQAAAGAGVGAGARAAQTTYAIDAPITDEHDVPQTKTKDKDTKYYVAGPTTFNIDEPVAFI